MIFLQLRNELWKLFGKRRTYIGSGMFLLGQCIGILMMVLGKGPYHDLMRDIGNCGVVAEPYMSSWTMACVIIVPMGAFMLPLYVALVGGDLVAKEVEDGTMRMILSRPVSRLRLLLLKWVAGFVFSILLVTAFGLFGALFARLFFPSGSLFVAMPFMGQFYGMFEGAAAWHRFAAAHVVMMAEAGTMMTLAFMFSCFNIKPAAATIMAISFFFISQILHDMPYFREYQDWLLVHHLWVWMEFFRPQIPWWRVGESLFILAGYNATFLIVGCVAFQMRDFKS